MVCVLMYQWIHVKRIRYFVIIIFILLYSVCIAVGAEDGKQESCAHCNNCKKFGFLLNARRRKWNFNIKHIQHVCAGTRYTRKNKIYCTVSQYTYCLLVLLFFVVVSPFTHKSFQDIFLQWSSDIFLTKINTKHL